MTVDNSHVNVIQIFSYIYRINFCEITIEQLLLDSEVVQY